MLEKKKNCTKYSFTFLLFLILTSCSSSLEIKEKGEAIDTKFIEVGSGTEVLNFDWNLIEVTD